MSLKIYRQMFTMVSTYNSTSHLHLHLILEFDVESIFSEFTRHLAFVIKKFMLLLGCLLSFFFKK